MIKPAPTVAAATPPDIDASTVVITTTPITVEQVNASQIDDQLRQTMAGLDRLANGQLPDGTPITTIAHVRTAIALEARALRRLIRATRGDLTGSD